MGGKRYRAHRVALALASGIGATNVPEGKYALHECDCKRCVNPEHLYWGSNWDNRQDHLRARELRGAKMPSICTRPNCNRPAIAKGLCNMHDVRRRRGQPMDDPPKRRGTIHFR